MVGYVGSAPAGAALDGAESVGVEVAEVSGEDGEGVARGDSS